MKGFKKITNKPKKYIYIIKKTKNTGPTSEEKEREGKKPRQVEPIADKEEEKK